SLVLAVTILGVSPAAPNSAAALASSSPTTLGTATSLGACATVRSTLLPLGREVPPCGDCSSTLPGLCVDTREETVPTSRPAPVSAASAAVCDSPSTFGTRT